MGTLAYDLLEADRGFREALRQARVGRDVPGRTGWPRVSESPRVVEARSKSPLTIIASFLGAVPKEVISGFIVAAITARLAGRSRSAPPVEIKVTVENHVQIIVVNGNRPEVRGESRSQDEPNGE